MDKDCFACRVLRSFAFSGLGAALASSVALSLGVGRDVAMLWAVVGAFAGALYLQKRQSGN